MKLIYFILLLSISCSTPQPRKQNPVPENNAQSELQNVDFELETVMTNLQSVYGLDWLPDGRAIMMERGKATDFMRILNVQTKEKQVVCNLPKVHRKGQGGPLDVLVHPDYAQNGWIYFSYSAPRGVDQNTLVIERAQLKENCLTERKIIFEVRPWHDESLHYGNRMQIKDGYLYFTMGERFFARDSAQSLSNHYGKILRLHDDGRIPVDNPFVGTHGADAAIWTYGHRNPQGLQFRPGTNQLWESEHGPQGGDEVNLIEAGKNYGWPVITFGENYGGGKIGEGITEKVGMEQPIYHYVPSIAPGGMCFYDGSVFPQWKGNLFLGALAKKHVNRLVLEGNQVVHEERLFADMGKAFRLVKQGPDGFIYLSTNDGELMRIIPKHSK